jgi:aryl-alcohol dehydrogenase-like predicted oxidoreductase
MIDDARYSRLGFGGTTFGGAQWSGQAGADLLAAMATALEHGITHFDTASGYGNGESERMIGQFIAADPTRRERMFIASKANLNEISARAMLDEIDSSLARLQTDVLDLYYIHWPRTGKDLRPLMDGLQTARAQGRIRAVGVSNFSVAQMAQIAQSGKIDAHQMDYSLLWRFNERDLIPYCVENGIDVVTYASLAHGILTGKFGRDVTFPEGDHRRVILLFREDVWGAVYEIVESMKAVAEQSGRSLLHLALRWLLRQQGVTSVLVSARNPQQAAYNAAALEGEIDESVFAALTEISQQTLHAIPDEGNPYGYHP